MLRPTPLALSELELRGRYVRPTTGSAVLRGTGSEPTSDEASEVGRNTRAHESLTLTLDDNSARQRLTESPDVEFKYARAATYMAFFEKSTTLPPPFNFPYMVV